MSAASADFDEDADWQRLWDAVFADPEGAGELLTAYAARLRAQLAAVAQPAGREAGRYSDLSMVLEHLGDLTGANEAETAAAQLSAYGYPQPLRVGEDEFVGWIKDAGDRLPTAVRVHLDRVLVTVAPVPPLPLLRELAAEGHGDLDLHLLGLFEGAALGDEDASPQLSPRIWLFQRNVEQACTTRAELRRQVAITLYHELGHYLGLDEDGVARLGLA